MRFRIVKQTFLSGNVTYRVQANVYRNGEDQAHLWDDVSGVILTLESAKIVLQNLVESHKSKTITEQVVIEEVEV
jgi:hypothetical protein